MMKGIDKLPADDRRHRIIGTIHRDMKKRTAKTRRCSSSSWLDPSGFEGISPGHGPLLPKKPRSAPSSGMAPDARVLPRRMQGHRR